MQSHGSLSTTQRHRQLPLRHLRQRLVAGAFVAQWDVLLRHCLPPHTTAVWPFLKESHTGENMVLVGAQGSERIDDKVACDDMEGEARDGGSSG
jgi:hypothetical protein